MEVPLNKYRKSEGVPDAYFFSELMGELWKWIWAKTR